MDSRLTDVILITRSNNGWYCIVDDAGCSKTHMHPFAAAKTTNTSARAHRRFPIRQALLPGSPKGFVLERPVLPLDLRPERFLRVFTIHFAFGTMSCKT